jgi:hypothetical protein
MQNNPVSRIDWGTLSLASLENLRKNTTHNSESTLILDVPNDIHSLSPNIRKDRISCTEIVNSSNSHFQDPTTGFFRPSQGCSNIEANADDACIRSSLNVHERREAFLNVIIRHSKGVNLWLQGSLAGFCFIVFYDNMEDTRPRQEDIGIQRLYFILNLLVLFGAIIEHPIKRRAGERSDLRYFVGIFFVLLNYFIAVALTLSLIRACILLQKDGTTEIDNALQMRTRYKALASVRAVSCIIPWTVSAIYFSSNDSSA